MESYEHREAWNKGKLVGRKTPLKSGKVDADTISA